MAQDSPQALAPRTKLEAFKAQEGAVILHGFSKVGELRGGNGSTLTVSCNEFTNATTQKKERGVIIEVKEAGTLEHENRSFIDYDELVSLLNGIDFMTKVDKRATQLDNVRATYRTRDELELSVSGRSSGEITAAVTSGTIAAARATLTLPDLGKLRDFIVSAKNQLDALK
jgi:hypothetical protein